MEIEDIQVGKSYGCKFKVRTLFDGVGNRLDTKNIGFGEITKFIEDGLGFPGDYEGFGVITTRDIDNRLLEIQDQEIEDQTWIVPWDDVWDVDDVEWIED